MLKTSERTVRMASAVTGLGHPQVSANAQVELRWDMTADIVDDREGGWNGEDEGRSTPGIWA